MVVNTLKPIFKVHSGYPESSPKAWHQAGVLLEVTQEYGQQLVNEGLAEVVLAEGHLVTKAPDIKKTGAKDKDQAESKEPKPKRKKAAS